LETIRFIFRLDLLLYLLHLFACTVDILHHLLLLDGNRLLQSLKQLSVLSVFLIFNLPFLLQIGLLAPELLI